MYPQLTSIALVTYLVLARSLRWRRYNAVHAKYYGNERHSRLTPKEAQEVLQVSLLYDLPAVMDLALSFSLFKTYAIPSISKLLSQTREMKTRDKAERRIVDTQLLISTWLTFPISGTSNLAAQEPGPDVRANTAIARTKWLHSKYKISNDDFLYTLSLFVTEPANWARERGWRPLSPLEEDAYYIFWCDVGERLGFRDIPETLQELKDWAESYEASHMVPAESNHEFARSTVDVLVRLFPEVFGIRDFFRGFAYALVKDRVRVAMMLPAQPWYKHVIIDMTMYVMAFLQRHICLPRIKPVVFMQEALKTPTGRYHVFRGRGAKPWYRAIPTTFLGRMFESMLVWSRVQDDVPGPKYRSEGYRVEELGPSQYENAGQEEVLAMAEQLHGCPFKVKAG